MSTRVKRPLLAAILCAAAIAPLAAAAYAWGPIKDLDLRILLHAEREAGAVYDVARVLVNLGDLASLLVLGAVVVAIGLYFGRRREVIAALVVIAGANLTTQLLKAVLEHARYKAWEHGVDLPWANSFPSGHTTAAASIAVALLFVVPVHKRLDAATVGLLLTAAVGISVVVLGWHYPSDVLGGLLVVATWAFAMVAALRLRADRDRVVSAPPTPPSGHWAVSTE
ncbi:MAG: phosphatase PAP2 family protein [Solirubrobacterales bacterium]